jgi:hypothetical protein
MRAGIQKVKLLLVPSVASNTMTYFFPGTITSSVKCSGSWLDAVKSVSSSSRAIVNIGNIGQSFRADASDVPLHRVVLRYGLLIHPIMMLWHTDILRISFMYGSGDCFIMINCSARD